MADMIVAQHALKLESAAQGQGGGLRVLRREDRGARAGARPAHGRAHLLLTCGGGAAPAAPAPGPELTFLEYPQTPASKFKPTQPLESTVMSVKRAIGPDAPGEICHVALQTGGRLPYVEGQSIGRAAARH